MTSTAKLAQRTFRLWAKMALLPVFLVSLLAACGYSGILSARDLFLQSDSAIDNTGGEIRARRILHLKSGGDIINDSTTYAAIGTTNITIRDAAQQQAKTGHSVEDTIAQAQRDIWTDSAPGAGGATRSHLTGQDKLHSMAEEAGVGKEFGQTATKYIGEQAEKRGNLREHEQNLLAQELDQRLLAETTYPVKRQAIRARMDARGSKIAANQSAYEAWKEGGSLCNLMHGVAGGVGGGSVLAGAASYATSALSPTLNKQNNPLLDFAAGR